MTTPVLPGPWFQLCIQLIGVDTNAYILKKTANFIVDHTYLTNCKRQKYINLLLIQDCYEGADECEIELKNPVKNHYVWIQIYPNSATMMDACDTSSDQLNKHF